jgi:hypothetical protein
MMHYSVAFFSVCHRFSKEIRPLSYGTWMNTVRDVDPMQHEGKSNIFTSYYGRDMSHSHADTKLTLIRRVFSCSPPSLWLGHSDPHFMTL